MYDTFNPYSILDVPSGASTAEINKAYRKKAKTLHPDMNGGKDAFQELSKAYRILKNPEARAHFDNTGTVNDAVDNLEAQALQTIVNYFNRVAQDTLDRGTDPLKEDLIQIGKRYMDEEIKNLTLQKDKYKRSMTVLAKIEAKLKVKKGNGLLKRGLKHQVKTMEMLLTNCDLGIKVHKRAYDVLNDYSFEKDVTLPYRSFYATTTLGG